MLRQRPTGLSRFLFAAAAMALYLAVVSLFLGQINDDAFITFRYARSLASGNGPYFNPGEHVEGYTNFILVPFAAAVIRIAGPDAVLPATKALSIGAGLAVLICTSLWVRLMLEALAGSAGRSMLAVAASWIAAALVACNGSFALNSTTGLETTLFSAWLMLGILADALAEVRGRWRGAGILFALACLTRPEGALYFAAAFGARLGATLLMDASRARKSRRRLILDGAMVAVVLGAQFVFREAAYDGDWLPNTFYAKSGGALGRTASGYLAGYVAQFWGLKPAILAIAPLLFALAAPWIASPRDARPHALAQPAADQVAPHSLMTLALPGAAILAASVAAILATGSDWMPGFRLLAPFVPVWSALTTLSIAGVMMRLGSRVAPKKADEIAASRPAPTRSPTTAPAWMRWMFMAMVVLAIYSAVVELPNVMNDALECRTRSRGYVEGHERLAEWLGQHTQPGQTVALMDIGIVGYRNPQLRILDVTGLTDRHIARSPGRFLAKEFDCEYIFGQRPIYLVIVLNARLLADESDDWAALKPFSPIEERLVEHPSFESHYHHPRDPDPGVNDLDRLAALAGATTIFRHHYPGYTYLLAVFEYRP